MFYYLSLVFCFLFLPYGLSLMYPCFGNVFTRVASFYRHYSLFCSLLFLLLFMLGRIHSILYYIILYYILYYIILYYIILYYIILYYIILYYIILYYIILYYKIDRSRMNSTVAGVDVLWQSS